MSSSTQTSAPPVIDTSYAVRPAARPRRRWRWVVGGGVLAVVVLVVVGATRPVGLLKRVFGRGASDAGIYTVEPITLNVTLKEDGELKPVNSIEVKCEVQGRLTIRWIVEESTHVKKDDPLVKLASDEMKDRVETEEIELRRITAGLEEAKQALTITRSENASKLKKAEIDLEVAGLELKVYLEGDYEKSLATININIKQTKMQIERKRDELEKSRPLVEKGFVTTSKIQELEDELERLEMTLAKHELELEILDAYELKKNKMQKTSAVERAQEELEREKQRATSREKQALAKVNDQEQSLAIRTRRFERLKEQLAKCDIVAPADGVVQYGGNTGRRFWGGNRIAPGEQVYQGQTLITIPDTSQMMVSTRIHEADRHKITEGLTCLVRVPAVPGHTFVGKLTKITQFADSEGSWWNPELKEHATEILLDETDAGISPGDTAHVEILIEEVPEVLAVPVQAVFARGAKRFVFVQRGGSVEPVAVTLGRSSTTMIEVTQGISAGDRIVLAPEDRHLALLPSPGTGETAFKQAAQVTRRATTKPARHRAPGGAG